MEPIADLVSVTFKLQHLEQSFAELKSLVAQGNSTVLEAIKEARNELKGDVKEVRLDVDKRLERQDAEIASLRSEVNGLKLKLAMGIGAGGLLGGGAGGLLQLLIGG